MKKNDKGAWVNMGGNTTISVGKDIKDCLQELKIIKQEPYDNVIRRVLRDFLDYCEEGLDEKTRKLINGRLKDVENGKVISSKELKDRLFS